MGIDYGRGMTNIDLKTSIRYGVISQYEVMQAWANSSEGIYLDPVCPVCGGDVDDAAERDYSCPNCEKSFWSHECVSDEAIGWGVSDHAYTAIQNGDDRDIFIIRSPYYTLCDFCSPCAPGAGHLLSPGNVRAYCLGADWFDDGKCPYPIFSVETNKLIY